ncbi:two-component sensor histidine kinase BarA [Thalassotalea sp. PS06]|uniref:two-component sensor histidine kinase BarA n=1 Tax=Thalassotalea sp. PS06 TaxID=2594005 RepID=UPI001163E6F2|nr:two-component sensor histidine kinase BarA [Thalassotalea sp. PS06]QDP02008.1 two-component sensor histidine kinase BarA [Thalassotalea sp. PS06]
MFKISLRDWVILLTILPTTVIGLSLAGFFTFSRISDLEASLFYRVNAISQPLKISAQSGLRNNNVRFLDELLKELQVNQNDLLDNMLILSDRLETVAVSRQDVDSSVLLTAEIRNNLANTQFVAFEDYYLYTSPITLNQYTVDGQRERQLLGYLLLVVDRTDITMHEQSLYIVSFLIILMSVLLSGVFANRLINRIAIPVQQMNLAIDRMRNGLYDTQIDAYYKGELEELRKGLNILFFSLRDYHNDLDRNIDQATTDLRESLEQFEIQNVELDLAKRRALEASRVKSEFLANMSHELRTPLNGVIGFTRQVLKTPLSNTQRDYLSTIERSANGLLTIINDILDFSKLDSNRLIIENIPFAFNATIEEAVTLLAPAANDKNLDFSVRINPNLPDALIGDAMRIQQVLTNLVGNAIKFTDTGSIEIDIDYKILEDSNIQLVIAVKDTGIGISSQQQENLFEAFGQADNSITRMYGGTGLGLVISKRLAQEMNGDIRFESRPDQGTTFWFEWQCQLNPLPIDSKPYPSDLKGKSVIVYDPLPHCRLAINELLKFWQMQVAVVTSTEQLLQTSEEQSFDMAVVGIHLLESNIDDSRQLVHNLHQYVEDIFVAVNSNAVNLSEAFISAGARNCFSKPMMANKLAQLISKDDKIAAQSSPKALPQKKLAIKVLAVDDNEANLKLISTLLSELAESVVTASNGKEAVDLASKERFAFIFMDIQMPIMDGITAMEKIRLTTLNSDTPVVAVTAHALQGEKDKMLETGFFGYMTKPIDETLLKHYLYEHGMEEPALVYSRPEVAPQDIFPISKYKSVIDWSLAIERSGNRPELAKDMLSMLLKSLPETKATLQKHLENNDQQGFIQAVHKLNGACCYNGVPRLEKVCREIETQLGEQDLASIEPELLEMFDEIDKLIDASEEITKSLDGKNSTR